MAAAAALDDRKWCKALRRVSSRSWKPHIPREAACSRQFPSPVVARGQRRWQVPVSAHQFRRPLPSSETREDSSIRSRSRKLR